MLKYNNFLNENVEQAKSYLKKNNISETDSLYQEIRKLTTGVEGYTGWLTKLAYEDYRKNRNIKDNALIISELGGIINIIKTNKYITDLFTKKIVDLESYEEFLDEYEKAKLLYSAKQIYNEFPSNQKSLVNLKDKNVISLLSKLNKNKNKEIFIKKISSYKNVSDLIDAIKRFLNGKLHNSFDNLIVYLHNQKLPIIAADESNSLIIAEITNYDQCRIVGGQTSWCIARSSSTFDSYVVKKNLGKQYIVYLTDLENSDNNRIIGVTIDISGYRTAHNVIDSHVPLDKLSDILSKRHFDIKKLYVSRDKITDEMIQSLSVKTLLNYFSENEILNKKKLFNTNDITLFSKEIIDKYNLMEKTEISPTIMFKYTKDEIISRKIYNRIPNDRYDLSMFDFLEHGFKRSDFTEDVFNDVFIKLDAKAKREYTQYLSKDNTNTLSGLWGLKYKTKGDYRTDKYDFDKTKLILEWYGITKDTISLERLSGCIEWNGEGELKEVIVYLKELGYEINTTDEELFKFFEKSFKSHFSDTIDLLYHLKECGLFYKEKILNKIFPDVNDDGERFFYTHKYESESTIKRLKELIGEEEYSKRIDEANEENLFCVETNQCAGYYWGGSERNTLNDESKWFEKWGEYATTKFKRKKNYYSEYTKTIIEIMLLLVYNNRFDLLSKVDYDFSKVKYNYIDTFTDSDVLHNLVESLADINVTNGKSKFTISDNFTSQQRYKLAEWLLENVLPVTTGLGEYIFALLYFLYDRIALNVFIDKIKKRGNPMGIRGLHMVFDMLCESQSYDFSKRFFYKAKIFDKMVDIKYILDRYTNGKKLTKDDKYFIKYKISNRHTPEIQELADTYLKADEEKKLAKTIKENFVFNYDSFIKNINKL